ncbi:MFS transporter [Ilumatobacter coccineus]|uniref:Putative major facilitator superfamily transporter n=1 Tax=Ilumatobacter coccineus (strain NBRC 103263 / KCTC 29153 / YM16-304) TaxID=1313172 RepID=A0A6C7E2B0_ILUCY|nr:MFS transporter [Ilumatobacter coccineus]BAN00602.1 putative major facilitator superfamily transporter [Ilumatobacter coccineus YM16-304]
MTDQLDSTTPPSTPEPVAAPPKDRLGANYFKLFGASTISNLGDGIGLIAYPWLASAVTRNPFLISLVAVVQRLPWLLFSLPAGVITDRNDRRTLMVLANSIRAVLTLGVAFIVLGKQGVLPGPDEINDAATDFATDHLLYVIVLLATLLMGFAEVLYDNSAQTFMPSIVHKQHLEKANGRLWSIEMVANTFVGPPLGALLLVAAFSVPFFFDAATFAVSAALIALIPATKRRSKSRAVPAPGAPATGTPATEHGAEGDQTPDHELAVGPRQSSRPAPGAPATKHGVEGDQTPDHEPAVSPRPSSWKDELREGFAWLWSHDLLRPMAIILGLLNMLGTMSVATMVLFAQEVLETTPTEFALLETGGAIGGVIGGWTASRIAKKIGAGPSLSLTLTVGGATTCVMGIANSWYLVWLMFAIAMLVAVLWNVITVSLRQSIIPDHLLGRVNSVYRFFAWGMMPLGAALGGLIVVLTDVWGSRELALRMPFFIAGGLHFVVWAVAAPKLTTAKIEAARAAAASDDD